MDLHLTFVVLYMDGETYQLDAANVTSEDGNAWFRTNTNRLLEVIPLDKVRRVTVKWDDGEAVAFDAQATAKLLATNGQR